ncbi:MAG: PqqD family protein [Ignavibacteriaceae bacterium]|nr:PqqD family protein [Ignavibacteriaceae bacterium]
MENFIIPQNVAISDSGFLFQAATGESFTLNEIGKLIVKMLQGSSTVEQIVGKVCEEYDTDPRTAERDFEDFITQLKHYSILK